MMGRLAKLYRTTIGKKVVMAVTGIILWLFVLVHMVGNLKVFAGPGTDGHLAKLDQYGIFLRTVGEEAFGPEGLLWMFRIVLLVAVSLHIVAAVQVWWRSRAARRVDYQRLEPVASTFASRTMIYGGIAIALFVVYHILHFTTGQAHRHFVRHPDGHAAVYQNVVTAFQNPIVSGVYIVAMIALGLHLYHGVWSGFQTLGVSNPRYNGWQRALSVVIAVAVAGGNIAIPVAVLAGIVK
jgi:succinate dehydrogenase / fumarate reductase cytochrome b subunit